MMHGTGGFGRRGASLAGTPEDLSAAAREFIQAERKAATRTETSAGEAEIDFAIDGGDCQWVEIELDPGEAVIAENGSMIWKDDDIDMELVLGDGANDDAGVLGKAGAAARAAISGESFYLTQFRHAGSGRKARVALGGREIGRIAAVRLDALGGALICRRGAYLAAVKGIRIEGQWQDNVATGLLGGEGLIMQRLSGAGWVFLHVGGGLIEKDLAAGERITVDSGCVVAHAPTVDLNMAFAGGLGVSLAGREGLLLSSLRGPGKVWIQSLPPKVASAMAGGQAVGYGVLGGAAAGMAEGVTEAALRGGVDLVRKLW